MATFKANSGLVLAENGTQPPGGLWRPWAGKEETPSVDRVSLGERFHFPFLVCRSLTRSSLNLTRRLIPFMETGLESTPKHHISCIPWGEWGLQTLKAEQVLSVCDLGSFFDANLFREGCFGPKPDALTTCTGTQRCCCATIQSKRPSVCMTTPAVTKTATTKRRWTRRRRRRRKSWNRV